MRRRRRRRLALGLLLALGLVLGAERALDWLWPYPLAALRGLPLSTVVTAADGAWLRVAPTPGGERVLPLAWREASPYLRAAVLAGEDERFFEHGGVDLPAIGRALASNLAARRVVSGASTLTMQVVRIVEPRPRTLWSKLVEALRARQLERLLDKEAIAGVWLTQVPLGGTLRGCEAAARHWFGRSARELDAAAAAALVAMAPAPSLRAPHRRPELLLLWRDALLRRMHAAGALSAVELATALAQPLAMQRHDWPWRAAHACDAALLRADPGQRPPVLCSDVDLELQGRLETAIAGNQGLPGDGLAVVVMDRQGGAVRALVGDRDPEAPLDLSRARRSAGSTLKPFLYALAHELGVVSPGALLDDAPLELPAWRPANFDRSMHGRMRPGDALAVSSNLVAVRCLQQVGSDAFAELLGRLGLAAAAAGPLHLDAALGTSAVTPRELAAAYWRLVETPAAVGLSARSVEFTLAAMRRLPAIAGQSRPGELAWKSGTSSGRRDAWCVGITARHVVVVWLGNRDGRGEAGLVGVRAAGALLAAVVGVL